MFFYQDGENPDKGENTSIKKKSYITIHNDDFHTVEFVVETLIEVCNHSPEQAEQCAWIIHYKGECQVKSGTRESIYEMYRELLQRGLLASIS